MVCIGGGSSTGLAKAIALSHGLPILAVPTTYAGSEMTPIYGLTGGRHKQTGQGPRRAAQGRRVRPGADARPAAAGHRSERVQRPRPLASRRCTRPGTTPWCRPWRSKASGPSTARCRRSCTTRPTSTAAATCSTARTWPAWRSAPRRRGCTTRSATCSAARSTSCTPTPTRSCCRTPSPSTRRRCPTRWPRLGGGPRRAGRRSGGRAVGPRGGQRRAHRLADLAGSGGPPPTTCPRLAERAAAEITVNPCPVDAGVLLGLLQRAHAGVRRRPAPSDS